MIEFTVSYTGVVEISKTWGEGKEGSYLENNGIKPLFPEVRR